MNQVLVVDDDPGVLNGVAIVLRRQGYQVVKASSGAACLEELRRGFHGVILMDIMMPGLTGWETIRAIMAEDLLKGSLICMLTARVSPGDEAEGLEEVVFDYLPKPFENQALIQMVRTAASFLAP